MSQSLWVELIMNAAMKYNGTANHLLLWPFVVLSDFDVGDFLRIMHIYDGCNGLVLRLLAFSQGNM